MSEPSFEDKFKQSVDGLLDATLRYDRVYIVSSEQLVDPKCTFTIKPTGCDVNWGSHGCKHQHHHSADIPHECYCCECQGDTCDPGCVAKPPYYGPETNFYGNDVDHYGLKKHGD